MGVVVSLMTRNQIAAAISCLCLIWLILFMGNIAAAFPFVPSKMVSYLSVLTHVDDFSRGSIDTRPVVLYLSGTLFMLFAAVRLLESRRWR
jgi:ABC-2 type transport system permease protein